MPDWIIQGKTMKHWRYPKSVTDEDIELYKDGLQEIIPKKLEVASARLDYLKRRKDAKLRIIQRKTKRESPKEYFWTLFVEHEFSEAYYIEKWRRYWLDIWQRVTKNPLSSKLHNSLNKISDSEIEKAGQHPLENLYESNLRESGSRLTGLCPFHEEKTPSFFIFPDNHYHCYGCMAHGDPVAFVMKLKGYSFPEAVRYLL